VTGGYPSFMRKLLAVVLLLATAVSASAQKRRAATPPWNDPAQSAAAWLQSNAILFETAEPNSGIDDLLPLRRMIGDARIVSLGEATHGTHEFFAMKHRMVEFLVRDMGFTVFGIEAALPETDRVNDYVLHGIGDPGEAVRGMGFWTWDVQEVVDLAVWMRNYNLARGDKPAVKFRGFDMQSSRYAIQTLPGYLQRVDPENASAIAAGWSCWAPYANGQSGYNALPVNAKSACAANLQTVHDTIAAKRDDYVARSSASEFETYLRYARVMQQHESRDGGRLPGRDPLMAENAAWLTETAHPGEKLVLWAHNFHVGTEPGNTMGARLRGKFPGRQMVIFAFVFNEGEFNSRLQNGTSIGAVTKHRVGQGTNGVERLLRTAAQPRMIVDLRDLGSTEARTFFNAPQRMWVVGAAFDPSRLEIYRIPMQFPETFDAIIWFDQTTASKLRR
jgi:erythromycin esterase